MGPKETLEAGWKKLVECFLSAWGPGVSMSSLIHGAADVAWRFIARAGTVVARTTRREVFRLYLMCPLVQEFSALVVGG